MTSTSAASLSHRWCAALRSAKSASVNARAPVCRTVPTRIGVVDAPAHRVGWATAASPLPTRQPKVRANKRNAISSSALPRRRRANDEELARGQRQSRCRAYREESPMHPVLALYEDVFANGAALALPAGARMIFLVHGGAVIAGRTLPDG